MTQPRTNNPPTNKSSKLEPTPLTHIIVSGASQHNLQDIDLAFPKNKLVVFSGLSGSGKSTLAFDTLYAEGQRRYVESLSSYARQFLGLMDKPEVDQIEGLSPAISIDQKTTSHNPRSTVGTITEIYDYLRLLFARIGHPHCPECGQEISTQSIDQIIEQVMDRILIQTQQNQGQPARLMILAPVVSNKKGQFKELFNNLKQKGYRRVRIDNHIYDLDEELTLIKTNKHNIEVVIDRLSVSTQELSDDQLRQELLSRLNQSIEQALKLADGLVITSLIQDQGFNFPEKPKQFEDYLFSENLACSQCGISLKELEPSLFSFNSPQGACPECNGLGSILKIDPDKMIAPELTLSEGAIIPFARTLSNDTWFARLVKTVVEEAGESFRQTQFEDLPEELKQTLMYGSDHIYEVEGENRFGRATTIQEQFEGFVKNLERRFEETKSDYIRREIEKYQKKITCPACNGARLKPKALSVKIDNFNIYEVSSLTIVDAYQWTKRLKENQKKNQEKNSEQQLLSAKETIIAQPILKEIVSRLDFLNSVGLNYLTLSREASTLAGGEAQRIRLASQIGTGLTGVLYILDEPTIGLHQRDNHRLIETLKNLRDRGNTVLVVEHDRDVILSADQIVDFGPRAGKNGGQIVAQGSPAEIKQNKKSLTGQYLSRKKKVLRNEKLIRKDKAPAQIRLRGATHHNLKSIDLDFPTHKLTCITGVSGSGKSTLMHDTLFHHLQKELGYKSQEMPGPLESIEVPSEIGRVKLIDQSPIGKTPRSNPATYTGVFDYIRKIYANTKEAKVRGYKAGRFSFNVKGGRCEACRGDGQIKIEMQFLPDVYVKCDVCQGKRYNQETLQVKYQDKNIAQILEMTIDEAYQFFQNHSTLRRKLKTLVDVGLGYLQLGQPAPTLSGGEAQRVKISRELAISRTDHIAYLLDEPTTGLHFADVQKLLNVLHRLVEQGNTVIVIEHNLDVIKNADWIIDLGPEGGEFGGEVVATGTPEQIMTNPDSFTGTYLEEELEKMG
ncbi:MAG: excinuclease ABC subunit UvrA [Candidatus Pacebacteria bacterium]|nr:excinuclease ABC subunit UvrA [Candidatus Paceibacterota bacterium]